MRSGRLLVGAFVAIAAGVFLALAVASASVAGQQTARVAAVPAPVLQALTELNNKLARVISKLEGAKKGAIDPGQVARTLTDLEATKLRALAGFPPVFGLSYTNSFEPLSCIDERIAEGQLVLRQLEGGHFSLVNEHQYAQTLIENLLIQAKHCKDALEVDLRNAAGQPQAQPKVSLGTLRSFDLTPAQQTQFAVAATTSTGTNATDASQLNADATLKAAYTADGYVGGHERDYKSLTVSDASNPDSWPIGASGLYFVGFDLFNTVAGAVRAAQASRADDTSNGLTPLTGSPLGLGETVFQTIPAGADVLSTIIVLQRGPVVVKIASACRGCVKGTVPDVVGVFAKTQLTEAEAQGLPK